MGSYDGSPDKEMLAVYRYDFEFKVRERVILEKILAREGALSFPDADLHRQLTETRRVRAYYRILRTRQN